MLFIFHSTYTLKMGTLFEDEDLILMLLRQVRIKRKCVMRMWILFQFTFSLPILFLFQNGKPITAKSPFSIMIPVLRVHVWCVGSDCSHRICTHMTSFKTQTDAVAFLFCLLISIKECHRVLYQTILQKSVLVVGGD